MLCSPISALVSWPRVTDVRAQLHDRLVAMGLEAREARWIAEEFVPANDPDFVHAAIVAAERRLSGEPLQYVVGHWPFRSLDLDVDPRVLIPRPETEELVDIALHELAALAVPAPLIADLGTGSGALILSIISELRDRGMTATGVAVDASTDALAVARRNALKHRVVTVSMVHSFWWNDVDDSLRGRFDLVVSNPPYIGANEMDHLDASLHYEPRSALVADDARGTSGLADIEEILRLTGSWLAPHGVLILEHGFSQGPAARALASEFGFTEVRTEKDLGGHDRFLIAKGWAA